MVRPLCAACAEQLTMLSAANIGHTHAHADGARIWECVRCHDDDNDDDGIWTCELEIENESSSERSDAGL